MKYNARKNEEKLNKIREDMNKQEIQRKISL